MKSAVTAAGSGINVIQWNKVEQIRCGALLDLL